MRDHFEMLPRAATGVSGLDYILRGGLARNRPNVGKRGRAASERKALVRAGDSRSI